jgi:serine/threonine protein kinase
MTPQVGSRLGQYEVLATIGAGGMGEVYRARESRLGREVAVRALPTSLAEDPERLPAEHAALPVRGPRRAAAPRRLAHRGQEAGDVCGHEAAM